MPRGVSSWLWNEFTDVPTAKQVRSQPASTFAAQVMEDHAGLSVAQAKVVAHTLLRCADSALMHGNAEAGEPT